MKRRIGRIGAVALVALVFLLGVGLWSATNSLLRPSWKGAGGELTKCAPELVEHWGEACGNLRKTRAFQFTEVKVPSLNGYDLPGWEVRTEENGRGPARGAILLVHGGGCDRREFTRHLPFFLGQQLDVLAIDYACHGEAPCPTPGLSYGQRESRDVLSAYLHLSRSYERVFVMGSSVGASSALIALPAMPKLAGVIAENPMASFQRLITESPAAQGAPKTFTRWMIDLAMLRGRFDGQLSPEHSLRLGGSTPILFIHSTHDGVVPVAQTRQLAQEYAGPKVAWFPEHGDHGRIWDVDHGAWERQVSEFLRSSDAAAAARLRGADARRRRPLGRTPRRRCQGDSHPT